MTDPAARIRELAAAIDRVRAIHYQHTDRLHGRELCAECADVWPCETVKLLPEGTP